MVRLGVTVTVVLADGEGVLVRLGLGVTVM